MGMEKVNPRRVLARNTAPVWPVDLGDGWYRNPILYADYSDPDVIAVGNDFYMTASSFNSLPGLPILHSKDLVHWTLIGHAAQTLPFGYDKVRHGDGIWAPSIRYHDGKFWIFVSMPDEGIFMTTAEDPAGPWTPLHLVKEVKGWIDPCPLWDDDGQAYLVHAFARSRCGIKHRLQICRMKPDGTALLDEGRIIFHDEENHPTMEGPKFYKRNGYYYIFAPAGGVATGWQTVLRSRNVFGPYEVRTVLHQGRTDVNGPHQGGYVELESGESWFIHFQDRDAYGRIVHLQPMAWVDDWPVMGTAVLEGVGIGEPVSIWRKPKVHSAAAVDPNTEPPTSDEFDGESLGLQWQWQANPRPEWYSLQDRPGHLRLFAQPYPEGVDTLYGAPHLLCQKFPAPEFSAMAGLDFHPSGQDEQAGLAVFGHEYHYIALRSRPEGVRLVAVRGDGAGEKAKEEVLAELPLNTNKVVFRVSVVREAVCAFSYSTDMETFHAIGEPFRAVPGGWVGAKLGLFASRLGVQSSAGGHVDIDWFRVTSSLQWPKMVIS